MKSPDISFTADILGEEELFFVLNFPPHYHRSGWPEQDTDFPPMRIEGQLFFWRFKIRVFFGSYFLQLYKNFTTERVCRALQLSGE